MAGNPQGDSGPITPEERADLIMNEVHLFRDAPLVVKTALHALFVTQITQALQADRNRIVTLIRAYHAENDDDGFWEQCHRYAMADLAALIEEPETAE